MPCAEPLVLRSGGLAVPLPLLASAEEEGAGGIASVLCCEALVSRILVSDLVGFSWEAQL